MQTTQPTALFPGESRRVIGTLETPNLKAEEMLFAAGLCVEHHAHETDNLIYIAAGEHWSGHRCGGDACAPGTVRFIPAGEPHENYFPSGSRCLNLELRRPIVELAARNGYDGDPRICAPGEIRKPSSSALGARLHREFQYKDDASQLDIETVMLELLVADGRNSATERGGFAPKWVLGVREMLREEHSLRPSLQELARRIGRHPVQISRQFHRYFGCTISEYLRRVRIARAQSLLLCHDLKLADIALACGFTDQSHFTTAFRRLTGIPPLRYRLTMTGGR
jgi:AraC family transcriptional regulator